MDSSTAPVVPRSEYPRPTLVRPDWICLNGEWEFSGDHVREGLSRRWFEGRRLGEKITVPFAYQFALSGIGKTAIEEVVWYARDIEIPESWIGSDRSVLLHFGAVDYRCTVWLNGIEMGGNEGGHVPFSFDLAMVATAGTNRITVRVEDTQDPLIPRGKQSINGVSRSIFYPCTTGIWQSVWLESAPKQRIENLVFTSELGRPGEPDVLRVKAELRSAPFGAQLKIELLVDGVCIAERAKTVKGPSVNFALPVEDARQWSPDDPFLYDVKMSLSQDSVLIDCVDSYAGIRTVEIEGGRVLLNGKPIYLRMVLDQGYWPDSGLTAPTDDALRADVDWCKQYGFNGARKHQKVEDPRWLYWCDRLGLLVWAEMPSMFGWSREAGNRLMAEWERAVRRDLSHPSIIAWVPMNESWGTPDLHQDAEQIRFLARLTQRTTEIDGSRPVIDNDGWQHGETTDLYTLHDYSKTGAELRKRYAESLNGGPAVTGTPGEWPMPYLAKDQRYLGQPVLLTEVGGFLSIPPDVPKDKLDSLYGAYGVLEDDQALIAKYRDIMHAIAEVPYVCGFCYTQLTDVEQEQNGLLTYGRKSKVDPKEIFAIHEEMHQIRLTIQ